MIYLMKKLSTLLLILLLATIFLPFNHVSAAAKAGIKPGSFFYFFDTTFEKINLFFTFNPEKKAQKNLEYADERLAEAEAVANEKNTDAVKTAVAGYENNIASAAEESKQVKDKIKTEELLNSIADNTSKHQKVLTDVLNKVPDEAKEAITKAIEASRKGQEEATKQIAELKGEVEKLKQEVAELKTKDEEQAKTVEKLNKQKSENASVPIKSSTPPAQTPVKIEETKNTNTTTLPNGAVVEMDANGKIIRIIKEAPINTTTQTSTLPTIQTETLEITSVNIIPDVNFVKIEWQTNKPTESKIFVSANYNFLTTVFSSDSGIATRHIAKIINLPSCNQDYVFEIEAIFSNVVSVKKSGVFSFYSPTTPCPDAPLGTTRDIKRSIFSSLMFNPNITCDKLFAEASAEQKICLQYRLYRDKFKWNIIDDLNR